MLNGAMRDAYLEGTARIGSADGVALETRPLGAADGFVVAPTLVETTTDALRAEGSPLLAECFGPVGVLARYRDEADLLDILGRMEGSLTASVHIGEGETDLPAQVLDAARAFAGRVLVNGYPTGVAVNWSMVHGGPWPASTNAAHTRSARRRSAASCVQWRSRTSPTSCCRPSSATPNPLGIPRRTVSHT